LDVDKVKLEILACGDVRNAVRIFFSQLGERLQLRGVQSAERDLDTLHPGRVPQSVGTLGGGSGRVGKLLRGAAVAALAVVVALAVGSTAEPGFSKDAVLDLALLFQGDFIFKYIEF